MSSIEVVGLGALNMDYLYKVDRILEDGETLVNEAIVSPGGSAANTIYGLAKLGINTGFTGVVGDDEDGKLLVEGFQKVNMDTGRIKVKPEGKTGSVFCLSDNLGRRSLYVSPGVNNLLSIEDIDLDYINQAEMLHISSFVGERQLQVILELVDKLDVNTRLSFSPGALYSGMGIKALEPVLKNTCVLFINRDEIELLTDLEAAAGAQACIGYGCRIVVVTLGSGTRWRNTIAASYILDADNEYIIEPADKNTVFPLDTTGAGDAFATGFLYGLLRDKPLDECGKLGDITARFSIRDIGARQGLPTLNELAKRYKEITGKDL